MGRPTLPYLHLTQQKIRTTNPYGDGIVRDGTDTLMTNANALILLTVTNLDQHTTPIDHQQMTYVSPGIWEYNPLASLYTGDGLHVKLELFDASGLVLLATYDRDLEDVG